MNTETLIELIIAIISLILAGISFYYTIKTKKRYEKVVMKLGNGEDITQILNKYIKQVEEIQKKDDQIIEYCNKLNNELAKSVKKINLVRYDAYNDTKNKLSFAIALLDRENNGIVINSVYGIDSSNIYAKPIVKGTSMYKLSFEEEQALDNAINNKN